MKHRHINEWSVLAIRDSTRMTHFTANQSLVIMCMLRINSTSYISGKKRQLRAIDNMRKTIQHSDLPKQYKNFLLRKLSMQLVSLEIYPSSCEPAAGFHESRRYNKFYE